LKLVAVVGDGVLEDDTDAMLDPMLDSAWRMGRLASDDLDLDFGSAATTMSEAPENHTRGVGWSSRQLLSNISAMVQLIFRLGGVPTGSANVWDSTRHVWVGSILPAFLIPNVGESENERRNVSMLSTRRFATKLRGRAGSTCTR
jgi:hypothetical protein